MPPKVEKKMINQFTVHGHRGCRGLLPENTIPAFKKAVDLGCHFLEMDVVITKDKVKSSARLSDCTYNYEYQPLKSKVIINSKSLDFTDSLDVYFDMSFTHQYENYIDTMIVKGKTRMGRRN